MNTHDLALTVECRTCPVRELHCGDCMVPVLLELTAHAPPPDQVLDREERGAITRLVRSGLLGAEAAATARVHLDPRPATDWGLAPQGPSEDGWAVG